MQHNRQQHLINQHTLATLASPR